MILAGEYFFTLKGGILYMKTKKLVAIAVLCAALFASTAYALQPEDALSTRPEDSIYFVLRLDDTTRLLKWICSPENIKLYFPLLLGESSIEQATFIAEFASKIAEVMPLRSLAVNVGMTRKDIEDNDPFIQAAFTVAPEAAPIVAKVADGTATASDIAKMLVGDETAAQLFESMLKIEPDKNNFLIVNNAVCMTAKDDVILVASSLKDIRLSLRALAEEDSRFLAKKQRRFNEKDFALFHVDYETLVELKGNTKSNDVDIRQFFAKPLEIEFAFNRQPNKFTMSTAMNLSTAFRKPYSDMIAQKLKSLKTAAGGNIDIASIGGKTSPLAAIGSTLDFTVLKEDSATKSYVKSLLRNLRVRFGISEEEAEALFNGQFSAVVNGNVTFEGFKIPALYMSFTGKEGAAAKVFDKIMKSQHFSKVQEGIYQLDTSISPIACLVHDRGETLGVYFAELASLSEKPEFTPTFAELMKHESVNTMWIDFAGIQEWINSDDNGVFATLAPLAAIMGYGKYLKALQDVLHSDLSVPSMAIWSENVEVVHTEFDVKDMDEEKGLLATLLRLYQEFNQEAKPAPTQSGDKK